MSKLLDIQGLRVHFDTLDGPVEALHSVTLSVNEGEIMGVVGESGCGKSVTSLVSIGLATCDVDDGSMRLLTNFRRTKKSTVCTRGDRIACAAKGRDPAPVENECQYKDDPPQC